MTIGERIKNIRKKTGMSQVAFADKINVSKQTLYKYENDIITNIPSDKIEKIAEIGNISPAYLMGWEDEEESDFYTDDVLAGINAMTSLLQYLYDDVDFHEYIMCETFDVILKKDNVEISLDENEYNLLFDFICTNIPNYINLIKGNQKTIQQIKQKEKRIIPSDNLPNAAHAIPGATKEAQQHDEDIMDDENF